MPEEEKVEEATKITFSLFYPIFNLIYIYIYLFWPIFNTTQISKLERQVQGMPDEVKGEEATERERLITAYQRENVS